jgi:hypothetical protein
MAAFVGAALGFADGVVLGVLLGVLFGVVLGVVFGVLFTRRHALEVPLPGAPGGGFTYTKLQQPVVVGVYETEPALP